VNERIDQLWGQALDLTVPETYSQLSHSQVLKVKQVFAELIVREFMRMCDSASVSLLEHNYPKEASTMSTVKQFIAEHFGVEE
jgi:hypothetical protein